MEIALYNMIDGGHSWIDVDKFIARCGVGRLSYNLENLWVWHLQPGSGCDGIGDEFIADGPCVFVQFTSAAIENKPDTKR